MEEYSPIYTSPPPWCNHASNLQSIFLLMELWHWSITGDNLLFHAQRQLTESINNIIPVGNEEGFEKEDDWSWQNLFIKFFEMKGRDGRPMSL